MYYKYLMELFELVVVTIINYFIIIYVYIKEIVVIERIYKFTCPAYEKPVRDAHCE